MAKTAVKKKPAARKPAAKAKSAARPAAKKKPAAKAAAKAAPRRKAAPKKAAPKKAAAKKPAARKAAAKKPAARKTTAKKPAAKKAPAKKAAARKPAAKKPAARGAAAKLDARAAPRRVAPARPARKPQDFLVNHYREGDFVRDGLRPYALYRELGVAAATDGLAQAHVVRPIPPCDPKEVSKLHFHDVDFQLVYVLKGWIKNEFEGQGEQFMRAGTCWIQPPGIKHKVLDYSDDCEVLEIILPAQFDTVTLD